MVSPLYNSMIAIDYLLKRMDKKMTSGIEVCHNNVWPNTLVGGNQMQRDRGFNHIGTIEHTWMKAKEASVSFYCDLLCILINCTLMHRIEYLYMYNKSFQCQQSWECLSGVRPQFRCTHGPWLALKWLYKYTFIRYFIYWTGAEFSY